jgi:hypothetical protein
VRVGGIDYGYVLEARTTVDGLIRIAGRDRISIGWTVRSCSISTHKRVGQSAVGVAVGGGVDAVAEMEWLTNGDAVFAIIDAPAVGQNMDIGTFRTELAVALLTSVRIVTRRVLILLFYDAA